MFACPVEGREAANYRAPMQSLINGVLSQRKQSWYSRVVSPNILIRNVPEDVHAILTTRAKAEGQSLQEYVMALLADSAQRMTNAEIRAKLDEHLASMPPTSLTSEEIVDFIREGRDSEAR